MAETWQEKVGKEFDIAFAPIEAAVEKCARVVYDAGAREARELAGKNQCQCFDEFTSSFWEGCPECGGKGEFGKGERHGAREEREAVVRRLSESFNRSQAGGVDLSVAYEWLCGELRAIEAGEHRKEVGNG